MAPADKKGPEEPCRPCEAAARAQQMELTTIHTQIPREIYDMLAKRALAHERPVNFELGLALIQAVNMDAALRGMSNLAWRTAMLAQTYCDRFGLSDAMTVEAIEGEKDDDALSATDA